MTKSSGSPLTPEEAKARQAELAPQVIREDKLPDPITRIAGVDVHYDEDSGRCRAAVAVLSFPALDVLEEATAETNTPWPYEPGLLSFREAPAVLDALAKLSAPPHLVICDGQGLAHPRRFGLACHVGVVADLPSIGCAKTRYIGEFESPEEERGAWSPLVDAGETVGAVLRTQDGINPVFVSIGHRVSLETAVDCVLACARDYRLPETTRAADHLARGH